MRRKRVIRRVARITHAAIDARRRSLEVAGAVAACEEARDAAYKRAWNGNRDYAEYHRRLPPCGESCACTSQNESDLMICHALGLLPSEFSSEREAELLGELDRLANVMAAHCTPSTWTPRVPSHAAKVTASR